MSLPTLRQIFRAQHNLSTILTVFYQSDGLDGSPSLEVFANGESQGKFKNPLGMTAWFARSSIKNLLGWRDAYHRSGLTGDDFKAPVAVLPARSPDVFLDVPYYSQRDNERYPGGACNVTSYAMVMAFFGAARRKVAGRTWLQREDELEAFLQIQTQPKRARHNHEDLAWMAREYGLKARFGVNRTWDEIRAQIRAGNPVIVSGLFTRAGHIIVLIGTIGDDFIVHDPWGDARTGYNVRNGKALRYTIEYLDRVVRDAPDSKWAHFISRGDSA